MKAQYLWLSFLLRGEYKGVRFYIFYSVVGIIVFRYFRIGVLRVIEEKIKFFRGFKDVAEFLLI